MTPRAVMVTLDFFEYEFSLLFLDSFEKIRKFLENLFKHKMT